MSTSQHDDLLVQLAAYLAGELDGDAADALQERIDTDPQVARLADDMADTLLALTAVDRTEPPAGFSDRLRDRLAEEIGHPLPATETTGVEDPDATGTEDPTTADDEDPTAADHEDTSMADAVDPSVAGAAAATGWAKQRPTSPRPASGPGRRGRAARQPLRPTLVAAVVVLLAVVGVGALTSSGFLGGADEAGFAENDVALDAGDSTRAADGSLEESLQAESMPAEESAADATAMAPMAGATSDDSADAAADDSGGDPLAATGPVQGGPVTLTFGEVLADTDADILDLLGRDPAVDRLMGRPVAEAAELALVHRDEVLRGPDFGDGTPAGRCLLEVLEQSGEDPVVAVAARLDLPEGPTVAYSLVRSRGGAVLDTVDVWLLDPADCALRRVVSGSE